MAEEGEHERSSSCGGSILVAVCILLLPMHERLLLLLIRRMRLWRRRAVGRLNFVHARLLPVVRNGFGILDEVLKPLPALDPIAQDGRVSLDEIARAQRRLLA